MITCPSCGEQNADRARFCSACGERLSPEGGGPEARKTVTVLFCDVVGSTAMGEAVDTEVLTAVMARYFDRMRAVLRRHGGTVEKFIGDAVVAVFGYPAVHEDDALRAVRAAAEMRTELDRLNAELAAEGGLSLRIRTGVNTGEVLVGALAPGSNFAAGDVMNTAARLEQTAHPGQILLGAATWRLVKDAVEAKPMKPAEVKGKADRVPAWRLMSVIAGVEPIRRQLASPLIGRDRQLHVLRDSFASTVAQETCRLVTVLGTAGVGKSRLVQEFVSGLTPDALVLRGRCLPYGEGITYWPIREIIASAAGIGSADPPEAARAMLGALGWDDAVTEPVAEVLGLAPPIAQAGDIAWAVRRALEALAREAPLLVVIDDIHWAEPTLLDLLDHLVDLSRGTPILLICISRPELLEERPGWGGAKPNAASVFLQPLTESEISSLVDNLLGGGRLDRSAVSAIIRSAGGNPLFAQQILLMLIDDGVLARSDGGWTLTEELSRLDIPPTIHALLATRLDQLSPDERRVIACASVVGAVFYRGAIAAMARDPLRNRVESSLAALTRKELITPDRSDFKGEEAYSFLHILIRDAAYEAVPKAERAGLHEAMAAWLADRAGERAGEYEEIVAYHLEQATRYLGELGRGGAYASRIAGRAAALLAGAGRRAFARNDLPAAINLLERAAALMPHDAARSEVFVTLAEAATAAGAFVKAETALSEAGSWSDRAGDERLQAYAALGRLKLRIQTDPRLSLAETEEEAWRSLKVLAAHRDDWGQARAWHVLAWCEWFKLRAGARQESLEKALLHARRAGARPEELEALYYLAWTVPHGPTPVEPALRRLHVILEESAGDRRVQSSVLYGTAFLEAMRGRFGEARVAAFQAVAILEELGHGPNTEATRADSVGFVEMRAGDLDAAEHAVRAACEALEAMGESSFLSTEAGALAVILCRQGRFDEADDFVDKARALSADDDVMSQAFWRCARARILASRGLLEEAAALGAEAVALLETTDMATYRIDIGIEIAQVMKAAARHDDALRLLRRGLDIAERKGDVISAERARAVLAQLAAMPADCFDASST